MPTHSDDFYLRFENTFRGTCDYIRSRQAVYLPILNLLEPDKTAPIIDIGSGRGEWLGLLGEHGWEAYGLDTDPVMAAKCAEQGFKVVNQDALLHFQSLPNDYLTAVTGFHVIEHLPFDMLMSLFQEIHRVLRPGGIMLFETPNPENLQMGASNFYMDPTHIRPLLPPQLSFLAQDAGFVGSAILRLHPNEELMYQNQYTDSPAMQHILKLLFGPQDFSIIAVKNDDNQQEFAAKVISAVHQLAEQLATTSSAKLETKEQLNKKICQLEERLALAQNEINIIKTSTIWRLTQPLRTLIDRLRPSTGK